MESDYAEVTVWDDKLIAYSIYTNPSPPTYKFGRSVVLVVKD